MASVVGVGAGGHAKVVIEILRIEARHDIIGLLDTDGRLWGTAVLGVPVLGGDALLGDLYRRGVRAAFVGVGTVGDVGPRRRVYERLRAEGFEIVPAIHPRAVVASSAEFGDGLTVMAGAVINAAARLGANVIVNTGAIVEHDCVVGDHVHVATGARLAGAVVVEDGAHIGLGASVRQGVRIGRGAVVGAGAVVVDDVPAGVTVTGLPARVRAVAEARSTRGEGGGGKP